MIYEILIRGNNAGEIVGGHVIRFNGNGGIGVAEEIPMVGQELDFDGILPESLQNVIPLKELEEHYNAELAEAKIKFDTELAEAKSGFDRQIELCNQQLAEKDAMIEALTAQVSDLQSQLQQSTQQVVSQEEILARLEALEAKP